MKSLLNIDKNSIQFKFWKYFVSFAALILIILWLIQIVFLNYFYKSMKINQINKIGDTIISEYGKDNFQETMINYAFQKGISIQVVNNDRKLIFPINIAATVIPSKFNAEDYNEFFSGLDEKENRSKTYIIKDPIQEENSILFVGYLGKSISLGNPENNDYFLVITTPLGPVDTTIEILKNQLIIVSLLSLVLALFLSYFISKRLAKPLREMSKTAQEIEKGNYNVEFKDGYYSEINNLAKTLNAATDELTKTIEMRKDLIANVSHDLKTPLTVIKSYGEMIRDISGNNEVQRNKHLETIITEADNLTILVNDLLDLSKAEANLEQVEFSPFDLKDSTEKILNRFKLKADVDGYDFSLKVHGDSYILGDKSKIEQVIYNLISNAVNYTGDDKKVNINITNINNIIKYEVVDTGKGINPSELDQIWNRYYRGKNNHARPVIGTGLGLYIIKSILEMHNFEYGVKSVEGKGSNFYFIVDNN